MAEATIYRARYEASVRTSIGTANRSCASDLTRSEEPTALTASGQVDPAFGIGCERGLRPGLSAEGRLAPSAGTTNKAATGSWRMFDSASSVSIVVFSRPRSMRPMYDGSMSAARPSASWERFRSTRENAPLARHQNRQ